MRYGFVADVHVGNHKRHGGPLNVGMNRRCRDVLNVLGSAVQICNEHDARLVVLGDLMDVTKPEAQILAAIVKLLNVCRINPLLLKGNHDSVSNLKGDHALGVLELIGFVVEEPTIIPGDQTELWLVPGQHGPPKEWLPQVLKTMGPKHTKRQRVLGFHLGVADNNTPPWLLRSEDKIHIEDLFPLMQSYTFRWAFAGNWHDRKVWVDAGKTITQCGALVPTGWDNPGLDYGCVTIFDDEDGSISTERIPGPRFLKAAYEDFEQTLKDTVGQLQLYVEVRASVSQLEEATRQVELLKANGTLAGGEVFADKTELEVAARTAAHNAHAAKTEDEAIASYIAAMAIPDGEFKQSVERRTKDYIRSV